MTEKVKELESRLQRIETCQDHYKQSLLDFLDGFKKHIIEVKSVLASESEYYRKLWWEDYKLKALEK